MLISRIPDNTRVSAFLLWQSSFIIAEFFRLDYCIDTVLGVAIKELRKKGLLL